MSMRSITFAKMRGVSLSLAPELAWLSVGALLCWGEIARKLVELISSAQFWLGMGGYILFVQVVLLLSLYIRRGAVAVAVLVVHVGGGLFFIPMAIGLAVDMPPAAIVVIAFVMMLLVGLGLAHWIGKRLQTLVASMMKIPALALTVRSLRTDNRAFLTYALRFILLCFVFLMLYIAHDGMGRSAAPGLDFFQSVMRVDLLAIAVIGVSYFSSVITEEKEDMTLGLLKMTGLSPVSILLGKSLSRLLTGLFLLMSQLPFTLVAVTLGGIDTHQVIAAYVALGAFLMMVYALALLASTVCKRSRTASAATFLGLISLLLGPVLGYGIVGAMVDWQLIARGGVIHENYEVFFYWILDCNAFARVEYIMVSGYNGPVFGHVQVYSNLILATILLALSWLLFNRCTLDDTASAPSRGFMPFWRRKKITRSLAGRSWDHAIEWLGYHFTAGGVWGWRLRFIGLAALFCLWGYVELNSSNRYGGDFDYGDVGAATMVCSIILACAQCVLVAGTIFQDEVRHQTLSSLALLPQPMGRVALAKVRGALMSLAPCLLWFLIGMALCFDDFIDALPDMLAEPALWYMASTTIFFPMLVALISLYTPRAAAAFAFGFYVLSFIAFLITMNALDVHSDDEAASLALFLQIVGCMVLPPWIVHRLRELAAQ